jgi:hypothetical protein
MVFNLSGQQKSKKIADKYQDNLPAVFQNRLKPDKSAPMERSMTLKSLASYKQQMDSLEWKRIRSAEVGLQTINKGWFAYDSEGRRILSLVYTCNTMDDEYEWQKDTTTFNASGKPTFEAFYNRKLETDPWETWWETRIFYDAGGNDTLILEGNNYKEVKTWESNIWTGSITYALNDSTGLWEKAYKTDLEYDSDGNLLTSSRYGWSFETGDWVQTGQEEFAYDAQRNQTLRVNYYYDADTHTWSCNNREERAFDSHGNETLYINYGWYYPSMEFGPQRKVIRIFDTTDQMLEEASYFWNTEGNQWIPSYKTIQMFDTKGHLTESLYLSWDGDNNQWTPDSKTLSTFDVNGNEILTLFLGYNSSTSIWTEYYRTEQIFEADGDILETLSLGAKDSSGQYTSKYKHEYSYNHSFYSSEAAVPFEWNSFPPIHMIVGVVTMKWDQTSGTWTKFQSHDYWYSDFKGSSSIPETPLASIRVFPNPVSDVIFIDSDQSSAPFYFELSDITGKKVISKKLIGIRNQVQLSELPGGLYLYRIIMNGESYSGKVVKR